MNTVLSKKRKANTNKGDYGHLLVVAGSEGMCGAACLTSEAALRSGCGLVTLALPKSQNKIAQVKLSEVMTKPLPQTKEKSIASSALPDILKLLKGKDAVVIGPGISRNKDTRKLILSLLPKIKIPIVLDADGLNAIAGKSDALEKIKAPVIMTPHPGEMARLIDTEASDVQKQRKTVAKAFATKYNVVLVLKGHKTIVAAPKKKTYINKTGNPGMATAGSGDVLSGVIGSFLVQGTSAFEAAKLGVYIHGLAGDLAAKDLGQASMIAGDMLQKLPEAMKKSSPSPRSIGARDKFYRK
ncbi:MAG: NAD(P)H-hydrate dehydratase [Candidatus Omnitrophota bacterium]